MQIEQYFNGKNTQGLINKKYTLINKIGTSKQTDMR